MSIKTELDRLNEAKANIITAIQNKKVTVPEGTTLDGLASLIDSIESGGGGNNITAGTITVTSYGGSSLKVEHGLGATPNAIIFGLNGIYTDANASNSEAPFLYVALNKNAISYRHFYYRNKFQSGTLSASASGTQKCWGTGTGNSNYDRVYNINDEYFYTPDSMASGKTYFWIAFKEALV